MALNIGTAVGKADDMRVIVDDVKLIAAAAAANPAFAGKTAMVVTRYEHPLSWSATCRSSPLRSTPTRPHRNLRPPDLV